MKVPHGHIWCNSYASHRIVLVAALSLPLGCRTLESAIENSPQKSIIFTTGSYQLSGRVVDSETEKPIKGAEISTGRSAFQTAKTDILGVFNLKIRGYEKQMSVLQIFVSKKGYDTRMLTISRTHVGNVYLEPAQQ